MNQKPPKRHHFLPKRYQAGFAGSGGRIWVFDRRRGVPACENPVNVGVENHFYTIESPNTANATAFESDLNTLVESPFWPVLDRLEKQETPTNEDRIRLSFFAAFFLTRIPAFRAALTKIFGDVIASSSILRSSVNSLEGMLKTSKGGIVSPVMPKDNALKQMKQLGIDVGKHLLTLDNHLMYSPSDEPFITTDNPLVLVRVVNDRQSPTISATSFVKWIPLSSKLAVGFGLPGNRISFTNVESAKVRRLNISLATASRQIVLARTREHLEQIMSAIPKKIPDDATNFPSVVL